MHDAFTRLKIFQAQTAEFLAPDAVIKSAFLIGSGESDVLSCTKFEGPFMDAQREK
jgi:hypothetical protein